MELFYIRFKGRVTGPLDKEDIQKRAQEGLLSRFHELSADGVQWKKAAEFTEFFTIPSDISSLLSPEESADSTSEPGTEPFLETTEAPGTFGETTVINAPTEVGRWHYQQHNGSQCGPLSFAVIQNLIEQGDIVSSTLIWANGLSGWTQAQFVPEFTPLF